MSAPAFFFFFDRPVPYQKLVVNHGVGPQQTLALASAPFSSNNLTISRSPSLVDKHEASKAIFRWLGQGHRRHDQSATGLPPKNCENDQVDAMVSFPFHIYVRPHSLLPIT